MRRALAPPAVKLDRKRHDHLRSGHADRMREKLAQGSDEHVEDLVEQTRESYLYQVRAAEHAETQATTLLRACSILVGLLTTFAVLRLSEEPAHPGAVAHRLLLGISVAVVFIPFLLAALFALDVTTVQHEWSRPEDPESVESRAGLEEEFHVQTLAALAAAVEHNASISAWKHRRLHLARRIFGIGLVILFLHPLVRITLHALGLGLD